MWNLCPICEQEIESTGSYVDTSVYVGEWILHIYYHKICYAQDKYNYPTKIDSRYEEILVQLRAYNRSV